MAYGNIIDDSFFAKKKAIHRFLRRHRRFWKLNRCRLDAADGPAQAGQLVWAFVLPWNTIPTTQNSRFNVTWGKFVVTKPPVGHRTKMGGFGIGNPPKIPAKSSGLGIITEAEGWYREACATNASALVGRTFWGLKMGHFKLSKSLAIPCTQTNGKWCWLDSFEMEGATSNSLSFLQNFRFAWGCQLVAVFGSMATCRSTRKNVGTNVTALTNLLYDLGQALEVFPSRGRGSGTICHFLIPFVKVDAKQEKIQRS